MSYYLKYRPQKIEELDLESVRKSLGTILSSNTFSHAYLFAGPKGTGKTSSARIVAKLLNCEQNQDGDFSEPCGTCDSCRQIQAGASMSVIEMDAASNRGIDDIRELKSRVDLRPAQGAYTVYVIDEVHMLTKEAFNALLKTLEEPPEHAVFILATTEAHKIPDTIISRCTTIQFSKGTPAEIIRSISKAIEGEGLKPDADAIQAIASRAEGSFRDGMKLTEQLAQISASFTLDDVNQLTGFSALYEPTELVDLLLSQNVIACLEILKQKEQAGIDASVFAQRILETVRNRLLIAQAQDRALLLSVATDILTAISQIKYSPIPMLPLELAVLKNMGSPADNTPQTDAASQQPKATQSPTTKVTHTPTPAKKPSKVVSPVKNASSPAPSGVRINADDLAARWADVLAAIKPHNHSLEALLRSAKPAGWDGDVLVIEVRYAFHHKQLSQDKHRHIIEDVISELIGKSVKVRCELKESISAKPASKKTEAKKKPRPETSARPGGGGEDLAAAAAEIFGS